MAKIIDLENEDGYIELDDNKPGLGLVINEGALKQFEVIE
jgi:hypothetical protein